MEGSEHSAFHIRKLLSSEA